MNRDDERFQLFSEYLFLHYIDWHYIISTRQDGYFLIIFKIAEYITLETYEKVFFTPKCVRHAFKTFNKEKLLVRCSSHIFETLFNVITEFWEVTCKTYMHPFDAFSHNF